ncbi:LOW QUALITY PROTEIN: calcium homeostasis endoplasmic reticulum protein [Bacillus rossius redtenbacheri]|uniref:LOW QUALITY PROTEIN: calcium homeostasis endoplasmic reticulum protein n=1 Tax=Bacillus rossius redtenbacheri TaxID=93214 RepID=UPI002FDD2465
MELPKPPQEVELRNIIDKLAQFVARNGPEFEQMTKNKQKGNPKFGFLFGGEHFNYYQYKVTTEQAILKQKAARDNCASQGSPGLAGGMSPLMLNSPVVAGGSGAGATLSLAAAAQWLAVAQQPAITVETLSVQQNQLQDQIRQSEQNLAAQHTVLMQQQQTQIEEALRKSQEDALQRSAEESGINFQEFDAILQPIIDSCTKDAISSGKGWILARSTTPKADEVVALHLLRKVISQAVPFSQKLHIIYLVNDVLHHCARKNAEDLKKALENVVVPMFCNASIGITEEQQSKLNKLLTLWESKNNYFEPSVMEKLKNPSRSWSEYQAGLITQHASAITPITTSTKQTYEGYQTQHQAFVQHALQQIQTIEQQKQLLEQQQPALTSVVAQQAQVAGALSVEPQALQLSQLLASQQPPPPLPAAAAPHCPRCRTTSDHSTGTQVFHLTSGHTALRLYLLTACHPSTGHPISTSASLLRDITLLVFLLQTVGVGPGPAVGPPLGPSRSEKMWPMGNDRDYQVMKPVMEVDQEVMTAETHINKSLQATKPELLATRSPHKRNVHSRWLTHKEDLELPDLSKPPPGFPLPPINNQGPPEVHMDELMPSVPYFELPAGLMVPLIKLEDGDYKPLDPDSIRLPPPAPPSDRLLSAVDAFYSLPCHDRPRDRRIVDSEGWEKLGLYEYYRAKNAARKKKEEDIMHGLRERSRSLSPIVRVKSKSKSPPKKRYRSKSRSRSRSNSKPRSRSKSRSRSRTPPGRHLVNRTNSNNTPSGSPPKKQPRLYKPSSRSRSRSNSKSRSRSRSGSRSRSRSRSKSRSRSRSRSKSKTRSRSRSKSRSASPSLKQVQQRSPERSPTPPSFLGSMYSKTEAQRQLDESNKGHQILCKMGWSGAGLGAKEQGIEQPISGGEVRDKTDMYKGVGISLNDPYENFRKSKGQAFINRMKARAEERL